MKTINLDFRKLEGMNKAFTSRVADSGDTLKVVLSDGGTPVDLTNFSKVSLKATKPNGVYVFITGKIVIDGVEFIIPSGFNSVAGYFKRAYVEGVTTDNKVVSTQDFLYYSYGDADISDGNAGDYISRVEELIKELNDKYVTAKALKEYQDSTNYIGYFGAGQAVTDPTAEYTDVKYPTPTKEINSQNRPFTINSDGTWTMLRDATLLINGSATMVGGTDNNTASPYCYLYFSKPANGTTQFISWGSTRATNGTLNYNWSAQSQKIISFTKDQVLVTTARIAPSKTIKSVAWNALTIEDITDTTNQAIKGRLANTELTPELVDQMIQTAIADVQLKSYPVGSIYINTVGTDPNIEIGGTWTRYAQGHVLVGVDENDTDFTAGKTGGEKTHKLTTDELASHYHDVIFSSSATSIGGTGRPPMSNNLTTTSNGRATANVGGDQPHNNLQPYVAVYMWRRTA